MKVMVVGIDGATFDVLTPLMHQGKLPHLSALLRDGVSGSLASTLPPLSSAAWSTFQTGKDPGKHGVFDFYRNDPRDYSCRPVNATFLKEKTLWALLSERGRNVGVANMLFTYPPGPINGFMVSGKETPGEDKVYTYPASLKEEILRFEPRYEVDPFRRISMDAGFLADVPSRLMRQERVNLFLYRKYDCDVFINLFAVPDVIHHIFWKHLDPSHPRHDAGAARRFLPLIEECYRTIDEIIGARAAMLGDDDLLMVISDHGGGPMHGTVQINRWLRRNNFLVLKHEPRRHDAIRRTGRAFLKDVYLRLLKYDVLGLRRKLTLLMDERKSVFLREAVDWSRTKAYGGRVGEYGIHCNVQGRQGMGSVLPGKEYEDVRSAIIAGLSDLSDPTTGRKVFRRVCRREEVYQGPFVSHAPDIMFDFGESPFLPGDVLRGDEILEKVPVRGLSGMHRPEGVLIAFGKGIRKGGQIRGASLRDLAPTILYAMDLGIPRDMDGVVLTDMFQESLIRCRRPVYDDADAADGKQREELGYTGEENEDVEKRLKDLGYL